MVNPQRRQNVVFQFLAILPIILMPPPQGYPKRESLYTTLQAVLTLLMCLQPPDWSENDIRMRIRNGVESNRDGSDVFNVWAQNRYEFWRVSGETTETFLQMSNSLGQVFDGNIRERPCKLNPRNKLLITLVWLRSYPQLSLLSLIFDVSETVVSDVINMVWPKLWKFYSPSITWPTAIEWQNMMGNWPELPFAVGSHRIQRPSVEPQQNYFSGHRWYHCFHTVVIVDTEKRIRYVHSGFEGHNNDALCFSLLPDIGPGLDLDFPDNCSLLADCGYSSRYPLTTPYKQHQLVRQNDREKRRRRKVNRLVRKRRVYVEHVIREMKIYKVISACFRHPRWQMSNLVELAAALAKRRIYIYENLN